MARWLRYLALPALIILVMPAWPAAAAHRAKAPRPGISIPQARTSGDKDGFGTAYTYDTKGWPKQSRVWFTLYRGEISEVYWPTFDDAAVNRLRFLVSDGHFLADEDKDMQVSVRLLDPHALAYRVLEKDAKHGYTITKTVLTDPSRDAVVMQVRYATTRTGARDRLYLHLEPTLGNSSLSNNISVQGSRLVASGSGGAMALATTAHVSLATVGYRGSNDAVTQLAQQHAVKHVYTDATHGRVAGTLQLSPGSKPFTVVLGFGKSASAASATASASLRASFGGIEKAYVNGWHRYTSRLDSLGGKATGEWYASAMTIKAAEDKTYEGAIVASPTHPFGTTTVDDPTQHGYVLVWPRDLYHASMGLLAAGDRETPLEALHFLAHVRKSDGSEPQNTQVTGQVYWPGVQMDEAADAVLLAWRLGQKSLYHSLVVPTARFIQKNGPITGQERWEENSGYSPASIATEIAALVAAADMAHGAGDSASQSSFLKTADGWAHQIESWTFTTTGPLGHHQYYLRITDGRPDASTPITIANGGGSFDQRTIVDPSFLELVRLGVRKAKDPHILDTLPVVDSVLKAQTPKGPDWHRYNHDGYGDAPTPFGQSVGHVWPVFDGERGVYDVAAGNLSGARSLLETMQRFAGPTGLIPEQVWEKTGAPTTSANPLIWAQGEYLVLLRSIVEGKVFDRPSVVAKRYAH